MVSQSPFDSKEIKPVHPKGNQLWIVTGGTDAEVEAESRTLWLPNAKKWVTGNDPNAR